MMSLARRNFLSGAFAAGAAAAVLRADPAKAGMTERVFVDHVSGLAILGFDPVGYFIEGKAVPGRADHEVEWANAVWRFESKGNAAAFRQDPEVYAPAFGGYDGEAMLRGSPAASSPTVFTILKQRLVLFRTPEGRDVFLAQGEAALAAADAQWATLKPTLAA